MVANYLQNIKAILISWMLLLTLTSFNSCSLSNSLNYTHENVDSTKVISRFLDLQVIFPSDTVQMGKEISIKVLFKNRTDSTVQFFPIAHLSLYKTFAGIVGCEIFTVNGTFDLTKSVELKPRAIYSYPQNIIIDESFFIPGENEFTVLYSFIKKKGKNMVYNELLGHLASKKIELIVKP